MTFLALAPALRYAAEVPSATESCSEPNTSDEALFRRYRESGDEAALEALIARHWPRVFRMAWRIVRDPALAEDAAQQAFVRLAGAGARYREEGRFSAWLAQVAVNEARAVARAGRRRARHEEAAGARRPVAAVGGARGPEGEEIAAALDRHLEALPEDLRLPIVLHYGEGLTHEAVADALAIPSGTASSRLRRGIERLRESLAGAGFAAAVPDLARLEALLARAPLASPPPVPPAPSAAALGILARGARAGALRARLAFGAAAGIAAIAGLLVLRDPGPGAPVPALAAAPAPAAAPTPPGHPGPSPAGRADAAPPSDASPAATQPEANPGDRGSLPARGAAVGGGDPAAAPARAARILRVLREEDGTPYEGIWIDAKLGELVISGATNERGEIPLATELPLAPWVDAMSAALRANIERMFGGTPGTPEPEEPEPAAPPGKMHLKVEARSDIDHDDLIWEGDIDPSAKEPVLVFFPSYGTLDLRIVSPAGRPWAHQRYEVLDAGGSHAGWGRTDDDGECTVTGVEPGKPLRLSIEIAGRAETKDFKLESVDDDEQREWVIGGDPLLANLKLGGVVKQASGAPAPAVVVVLRRPGLEIGGAGAAESILGMMGSEDTAMSDLDGSFQLRVPEPGRWTVVARSMWGSARAEVDVRAPGAEVTLVLGEAARDDATIRGTVEDAHGRPLAGVDVTRYVVDASGARGGFGSPILKTDAEGRFEMTRLPRGALLEVVASAEGYGDVEVRPGALREGENVVRLRFEAEPGRILFRVRPAEAVEAPGHDLILKVTTGNSTHFNYLGAKHRPEGAPEGTFALRVPPGEHEAYLKREGWLPRALPSFRIEGGETIDLGEVVLSEARALALLLVDEAGTPVAGVEVFTAPREFWAQAGRAAPAATSDEAGATALPAKDAAEVEALFVYAPGFAVVGSSIPPAAELGPEFAGWVELKTYTPGAPLRIVLRRR